MSWSVLANNQTVTRVNLQDAINNGYFSQKTVFPVDSKCINKSEALSYVEVDSSYMSEDINAKLITKDDLVALNLGGTTCIGSDGGTLGIKLSDNTIVLYGLFTHYTSPNGTVYQVNYAVRIREDGQVQNKFTFLGEVTDVKEMSNGDLVFVGNFDSYTAGTTSYTTYKIVRTTKYGAVVNTNSVSCNGTSEWQIDYFSDGKILLYAIGLSNYAGNALNGNAVILNSNLTFNSSPPSTTIGGYTNDLTAITKLTIDRANSIIYLFDSLHSYLIKCNLSFNYVTNAELSNGTFPLTVQKIYIHTDGKIWVVGRFSALTISSTTYPENLFILNSNFTYNSGFSSTYSYNSSIINDLIVESDGKFVISGTFDYANGYTNVHRVAKFNSSGVLLNSFGTGSTSGVISRIYPIITAQRYMLSGTFTNINGDSVTNIAVYDISSNSTICNTSQLEQVTINWTGFLPDSCSGGAFSITLNGSQKAYSSTAGTYTGTFTAYVGDVLTVNHTPAISGTFICTTGKVSIQNINQVELVGQTGAYPVSVSRTLQSGDNTLYAVAGNVLTIS